MKAMFSARIATLAVLPEWAGKGIGTALVNKVLINLIDAGYVNIYVAVQSDNKAAVRVYTKAGFKKIK